MEDEWRNFSERCRKGFGLDVQKSSKTGRRKTEKDGNSLKQQDIRENYSKKTPTITDRERQRKRGRETEQMTESPSSPVFFNRCAAAQ